MQWLAAVCVRRPVFTWVLMLSLVVVGASSVLGLGVDRYPNIDFPMVMVTTELPGASPEQVETEVTDKIEEAINSIEGLDLLRSTSYEGLSVVAAQFVLEKNVALAAQDVRDRVNRTIPLLPDDAEQPRVERMDPDASPVMLVALSGRASTRDLTEYGDKRVRRLLESTSGVGGVTVLGGRERQVDIVLDPRRLDSLGLTVVDVERALRAQNVEVPGGDVEQGPRTLQLRVLGRVPNVQAFGDIAITRRDDRIVRLSELARIVDSEAQPTSSATLNGKSVVIISIRKQSGTNTVAVVDALRERVDTISETLPRGYSLRIVRDESEFIRNAIHAVQEHLILGAILAALVVLMFLRNMRTMVISALAIPTSIIATFALIKAMGLTLNTITLLSLTLAVGIVIDDAIVVLENIFRFIDEKGYAPRRAAILGTKEIGLAVLATTMSLVAVFLPIAFMGGIVGRFMRSFGFTMSFAVLVSLLVSFTLTPMLASRWLKKGGAARPKQPFPETSHEDALEDEIVDPPPEPRQEERAAYREWRRGTRSIAHEATHGERHTRGLYAKVENGYVRLLALVMGRRWIAGIAIVIVMVMAVPLGKIVAKNFLPIDDESRFEVTIRAPEGNSLAETSVLSERVARDIRSVPGVDRTVVTVGSPPGDPSGRGPNQSSIFVGLVDPTKRTLTQQDIMTRVRANITERYARERLRVIVAQVNVFGASGADAASVQYVINGPDLERLADYSQRLLTDVKKINGLVDADSSLIVGKPELVVRIDRARAADLGVNVGDIAAALRSLVGGVEVTTYNEGGEQYEVHVRSIEEYRRGRAGIEQLTVPAGPGRTVRLGDVVDIGESTGPSYIQRIARQRMVMIYGNTTPGTSETAILQQIEAAKAKLNMGPEFQAQLMGRSRELGRAQQSFLLAFFLSIVFMYLVLAAQFESWIHPVTILSALPLTIPFALLSLVLLGESLNIFSALGTLVLLGMVKKNSILQVDHTRALRRTGLSRADAVMLGSRDRLRPILMTTAAFVAGMIPLVASTGAGAGTNRAMGSVIIGGQTLSLLLTLVATPVVYSWFDDLAHSRRLRKIGRVLTYPVRAIGARLARNKQTPVGDVGHDDEHVPTDKAAE